MFGLAPWRHASHWHRPYRAARPGMPASFPGSPDRTRRANTIIRGSCYLSKKPAETSEVVASHALSARVVKVANTLPRALLASDPEESGALVESCHAQCIRVSEWFNP